MKRPLYRVTIKNGMQALDVSGLTMINAENLMEAAVDCGLVCEIKTYKPPQFPEEVRDE